MPKVGILISNYNGWQDTLVCLDSLQKQTFTDFEVILIDDASPNDSVAQLQNKLPPNTVFLPQERNVGFAAANNIGMRRALDDGCDFALLLNNDTEVTEDTLHYLCETLDGDRSIGAVCPKIRFFAPPQHIQFAGYTPLTRITLRNALIGFGEPDDGRYDTPHDTPYAHGAAMMVRRETLEKAGPMPEVYFLYYEELDWSVRIREQGRRIAYDPRCTVFHKESATTGQQSPLRSYCLTRNRLLFAWRNLRGGARLLSVAYQLCIAAPKNAVSALAHRRGDLAKAVCRGVRDFFTLKDKQS